MIKALLKVVGSDLDFSVYLVRSAKSELEEGSPGWCLHKIRKARRALTLAEQRIRLEMDLTKGGKR